MEQRCRQPIMVGIARAEGYRFTITTLGVATLLTEPDAVVYGLLWRISRPDEASLDRYEGTAEGFYRKHTVAVSSDENRSRSALVYIATESRAGRPRPGYLEAIISAAREFGFPGPYIDELCGWSRLRDAR
jgi:cation transport regulator ChaC